MNRILITTCLLLACGLTAQGTAVFPADYAGVTENAPNLPFARGTGRALTP